MGVIKANVPAALRTTPYTMADIEAQARAMIARAKQEAEKILADARVLGEEIKRKAHSRGLAGGYDDGVTQGVEEGGKLGHAQALEEYRARFTQVVEALSAATTQIEERRRELDSDALRDVIGLSVRIAERVTKRQGMYDPEIVLGNVRECLQLIVGAHDLRIAIHPDQKSLLADSLPRLKMEMPSLQHVELTEDESISPGGCRIFTRQGQIDADLDTQLNRIASELIPSASSLT